VLDDSEVERVLVVTAHPDDVDFGAAGTISTFTAAGVEVTYCVCTDGDAGRGERRDRPRRTEVDVVGMGGHHQHPLDLAVVQHVYSSRVTVGGHRRQSVHPGVQGSRRTGRWLRDDRAQLAPARHPRGGARSVEPRPRAGAGRAGRRRGHPTDRSFSTAIDAYPRWERESSCDPVEKRGPKYLRKLLLATYGPVSSNIVRPCTAADSGHEEGRALDWMVNVRVPEQKAMGDALVAWLQAPDGYGNPEAMARRLGISYVIWNNQTWRAYDPARGWTEYNGCLAKKKQKKAWDNTCHRTHVHVSFTWDGANKRTSYYTGYVACPAPWRICGPTCSGTSPSQWSPRPRPDLRPPRTGSGPVPAEDRRTSGVPSRLGGR
jgi:hypothetical protein